MKNKISVLLFIALALCSCVPEAVHVSGITLNTTTLTIPLGNCEKLTAHISPSNADNQAVIWTSGNASVASVEDGNVTALSPGETSVTATSDDGGLTAVCKIIVPEVIVPVTGIKLDKETLTMVVGQSEKLTATIEPENASYQDVRWTTSDPTVAAIKEDGTVTALALGKAFFCAQGHIVSLIYAVNALSLLPEHFANEGVDCILQHLYAVGEHLRYYDSAVLVRRETRYAVRLAENEAAVAQVPAHNGLSVINGVFYAPFPESGRCR